MADYPNKPNSPVIMLKLRMSMFAGLCCLVGASSALAAQRPEEIVALAHRPHLRRPPLRLDRRRLGAEEAQQNQETAQHRVLIRHRNDVASGWRFLLDGRELAILTVIDPDQSRRFLSCLCEEAAR